VLNIGGLFDWLIFQCSWVEKADVQAISHFRNASEMQMHESMMLLAAAQAVSRVKLVS
jgi:hypothetical protein